MVEDVSSEELTIFILCLVLLQVLLYSVYVVHGIIVDLNYVLCVGASKSSPPQSHNVFISEIAIVLYELSLQQISEPPVLTGNTALGDEPEKGGQGISLGLQTGCLARPQTFQWVGSGLSGRPWPDPFPAALSD